MPIDLNNSYVPGAKNKKVQPFTLSMLVGRQLAEAGEREEPQVEAKQPEREPVKAAPRRGRPPKRRGR